MGFEIKDVLLAAAAIGAIVATGGAAAAPIAGAAAGTAATGAAAGTAAAAAGMGAGAATAGVGAATAGTAATAGGTAASLGGATGSIANALSTGTVLTGEAAAGVAGSTGAGTTAAAGASKAAMFGKIATGTAAVSSAGQAYVGMEQARITRKRAEMEQQIGVKQQLRAARIARAGIEASGAKAGTGGGSSYYGALGSVSSNLGSNLGILAANRRMDAGMSKTNLQKTGFGLLGVGSAGLKENKEFLGGLFAQNA